MVSCRIKKTTPSSEYLYLPSGWIFSDDSLGLTKGPPPATVSYSCCCCPTTSQPQPQPTTATATEQPASAAAARPTPPPPLPPQSATAAPGVGTLHPTPHTPGRALPLLRSCCTLQQHPPSGCCCCQRCCCCRKHWQEARSEHGSLWGHANPQGPHDAAEGFPA